MAPTGVEKSGRVLEAGNGGQGPKRSREPRTWVNTGYRAGFRSRALSYGPNSLELGELAIKYEAGGRANETGLSKGWQ